MRSDECERRREIMERAAAIQGRAPNVTELTGCEDDGEMNAEDREALKRHDLLIDENRDRITSLMSEYRSDQKWLREAMTEQGKKIDRVAERVDSIDRTVNNGIKERQLDISQRLAKVETALDGVVTQDEMAVHREESEKLNREKWDGHERRAAEKRKNTGLIIAVVGNLLTLASVVALYLSLGG